MSKKLQALIVDDEPLARGRLRALLKTEPEIELIGEIVRGRVADGQWLKTPPPLDKPED